MKKMNNVAAVTSAISLLLSQSAALPLHAAELEKVDLSTLSNSIVTKKTSSEVLNLRKEQQKTQRLKALNAVIVEFDKFPTKNFLSSAKYSALKAAVTAGKSDPESIGFSIKGTSFTKGSDDVNIQLQSDYIRVVEYGYSLLAQADNDNVFQIYEWIYNSLPASLQSKFTAPSGVMPLKASVINSNISALATNLDVIKYLKESGALADKPSSWDADCSDEYGADSSVNGDRADSCFSSSSTYSWASNGIMKNKNFPLKYYNTCVKSQGSRGTCSAFATVAALEVESYKEYEAPLNFSEQFAYWFGETETDWPNRYTYGLVTSEFISGTESNFRFELEALWDYNASSGISTTLNSSNQYSNSCPSSYAGELCTNYSFQSNETVHRESTSSGRSDYTLTSYSYDSPSGGAGLYTNPGTELPMSSAFVTTTLTLIQAFTTLKRPVIVSLSATDNFQNPTNGYVTYASGEDTEDRGHAVLVVGWIANADLPSSAPNGSGGGYFIVKNSWGVWNGDCGYYYVPYNFLKTYAYGANMIGEGIAITP